MKKQGACGNDASNPFAPSVPQVTATVSARGSAFVTVWKIDLAGTFLNFKTQGTFIINWGDGCVEHIKQHVTSDMDAQDENVYHQYEKRGEYTVSFHAAPECGTTGDNEDGLSKVNFVNSSDKLIEIKQWGAVQWKNMNCMFYSACNMVCTATDTPDLSQVTNIGSMFNQCALFNSPIAHWDFSNVVRMNFMLEDTIAFDQDLRGLNTSLNTLHLFGWNESLDEYNAQHAEKYKALDEKEDFLGAIISDPGRVSLS